MRPALRVVHNVCTLFSVPWLLIFLVLMRRPPRSTPLFSSAASDVYKGQGVAFSRRVSSRSVVAEQLHPGPVVPGERRMPRVSDVVADNGGRRFAGLVVAGADAGGEGKATESVRGIGKARLTRSAEAIHLKGQEETPLERFALPLGDARREPWQIRRTRAHLRGEVPLDPSEGDPSLTPPVPYTQPTLPTNRKG